MLDVGVSRTRALRRRPVRREWAVLTAVAGILGVLVIGAWAVVAWGSKRRQPWLLAPLALLVVVLVATGRGGWAFLPIALLLGLSFAELVIGSRESPSLRARDRDGPLSTERWAVAVAAPFRVAVAEPWDVISRPQLRRRYRSVLEEEWGITDRAGLLATVEALWEELHSSPRAELVIDLHTGVARTRLPEGARSTAAEEAFTEQQVRLTPEQVERMREVTGAEDAGEPVVVGSYGWWKSAHLVRLACGGATLNWLSQAETRNLLRRVATDLQRRFSGWDRLAAAFHGGYLLWRGGTGGEGEPDRVWTALGILTTDDDSPWRLLPWDMPLERVPYETSGTGEGSYMLPGAVPGGGPPDGGAPGGRPDEGSDAVAGEEARADREGAVADSGGRAGGAGSRTVGDGDDATGSGGSGGGGGGGTVLSHPAIDGPLVDVEEVPEASEPLGTPADDGPAPEGSSARGADEEVPGGDPAEAAPVGEAEDPPRPREESEGAGSSAADGGALGGLEGGATGARRR